MNDLGKDLKINPKDNVATAPTEIAVGGKIIKHGDSIGAAILDIHPGEHVHISNVKGLRARN